MGAEVCERDGTELVHRVLLVEEQPRLAEWLREILEGQRDIVVAVCDKSSEAVESARAFRPTLIVQDLALVQRDGLGLLERFREIEEFADVPVIVLAASGDGAERGRAFERGATDYLEKVPHPIELVARVRAHSRAFLRPDAALPSQPPRPLPMRGGRAERVALRAVQPDALTGLASRRSFDEALGEEWYRGVAGRAPLSFALVDIDHFKRYNARYGETLGDECLRRAAGVVATCARRAADLATRYGGEEFGLLLPNTPAEGARIVAERVRAGIAALELPHDGRDDGHALVSVSVGVATMLPSRDEPRWVVVESAGAALLEAKRRGRNAVLHALLDR